LGGDYCGERIDVTGERKLIAIAFAPARRFSDLCFRQTAFMIVLRLEAIERLECAFRHIALAAAHAFIPFSWANHALIVVTKPGLLQ
jgi:hypothetical protein